MMVSVHMVNGESGNPKMEDSDDGKCSHGHRESGNSKMEVIQMEDSDDGKCSHGQQGIRKSQDGGQ